MGSGGLAVCGCLQCQKMVVVLLAEKEASPFSPTPELDFSLDKIHTTSANVSTSPKVSISFPVAQTPGWSGRVLTFCVLFLQSVQNDSLSFDEEDILKVYLIAFIERDKKKQL